MFTKPIYSQEYQNLLRNICFEIKTELSKQDYKIIVDIPKLEYPLLTDDKIAFLSAYKSNPKTKIIVDILMRGLRHAEIFAPGSGLSTLLYSTFLIDKVLENKEFLPGQSNYESVCQSLQKRFFYANKDLLQKLLAKVHDDKLLIDLAIDATNLAGLEGKVSIEKTSMMEPTIVLETGYQFDLNVVGPLFKKSPWRKETPYVIVIDGYIESVGELHNILTTAFSLKAPIALFATGFDPEIITTLMENKRRNLLDIIPIKVNVGEINSANCLNDIALISQANIISSFTGDLISAATIKNFAKVDKIEIIDNHVVIYNKKTLGTAKSKIQDMLIKSFSSNIEELSQSYLDRMKSLSSKTVKIYLPHNSETDALYQMQKLHHLISSIKSIINFGYCDIENYKKDIENKNMLEEGIKVIYNNDNIISSAHIASVMKFGYSTAEMLLNTRTVLLND